MTDTSQTPRTGGAYTEHELRDRLSISTLVFFNYRPLCPDSLRLLTTHGIRRIELLESPDQFDMADPNSMSIIRSMCADEGIEIGAYHAHNRAFLGLSTKAKETAEVDLCRRQVDTMLEAGCRVWGCHAQSANPVMERCLEAILRHAEGTPAVIAIENFIGPRMWVEDRVELLRKYNHPQLRMILDIGHVRTDEGANPMTLPGGPTETLALCGEYLCHIHMHGFMAGVDHHPPMAPGDEIQWRELFIGLRAVDYSGFMHFEPRGFERHPDVLAYTQGAPAKIAELLSS